MIEIFGQHFDTFDIQIRVFYALVAFLTWFTSVRVVSILYDRGVDFMVAFKELDYMEHFVAIVFAILWPLFWPYRLISAFVSHYELGRPLALSAIWIGKALVSPFSLLGWVVLNSIKLLLTDIRFKRNKDASNT